MLRKFLILAYLISHISILISPASAQTGGRDCSNPPTGFKAQIDISNTGFLYPLSSTAANRQKLGLYSDLSNTIPAAHRTAALAAIAQIVPRDTNGNPSATGKIGLAAIGVSNTKYEFQYFMDNLVPPSKSASVILVNGAKEGQGTVEWAQDSSVGDPWGNLAGQLSAKGVDPDQLQAVWLKITRIGPSMSWPDYAQDMYRDLTIVVNKIHTKYPSVKIVFVGNRIYGGYSDGNLSPEPAPYEGGFALRWLIQDQQGLISSTKPNSVDITYSNSPVLVWGPYLWADDTNPNSEGLSYVCEDFYPSDGVHPEAGAMSKVSQKLASFFTTNELAASWFTGTSVTPPPTSPTPTPTLNRTPTPTPPGPTVPPGTLPGTLTLTPQSAPAGFQYWNFTYGGEPGWATTMTGIILKPTGSGPYRGVVINHGKGGTAYGFSLAGAQLWFYDYVSIGPNYTHAGGGYGGGGDEGGSTENVKRAQRAIDILQSQELADVIGNSVQRNSIYMYGNSMGGFVAVETSSKDSRLSGVAYTASGLSGTMTPGGAAQAATVTAPFLQLHGTTDGTVAPQASIDWDNALTSYNKPHQLIWFEGYGHDISSNPATASQCRDYIRNWFTSAPPVSPTPSPPPSVPGDANGDGVVNGVDYVIWFNHYKQTGSGGPGIGDFNSSGFVDGVDYVIWLNNYNS